MKVFQIWIGEVIPTHVKMCYESMSKFHKPGDEFIFFTDRPRDDLPSQYKQVDIWKYLQSSKQKYYMTACGLNAYKRNVATLVDLMRFAVLADPDFAGWSYIDSDILMVRDPRQVLEPLADSTILYKESYNDFACVGVITNPVVGTSFMKSVADMCCDYVHDQISSGLKINIKDLMNKMDALRKTRMDEIDLRSRVYFFKIGYSAMCNRIRDGSLQQKDFDAIMFDEEVKGVHLWRPESMPRVKAFLLDEFAGKIVQAMDNTERTIL